MWYSGGERYEPEAIGYAVSPYGVNWTKHPGNPVFKSDPRLAWESHKVTGCQVMRQGDWHVMFCIGFRHRDHAQIGIARSRAGVAAWRWHPAKPIICPTPDGWDHDACYKPFALFDGEQWRLWYSGRHGSVEQIGVAFHEGEVLGFEAPRTDATESMAPGGIEEVPLEGPQININPPGPGLTGKLWNDGSGVLDDELHQKLNLGSWGMIGLQIHSYQEPKLRFKDTRIEELARAVRTSGLRY